MSDFLNAYEQVVGPERMDQLYQIAKPLQGKKFVHVNSTRYGGGVAEILHKMIPLLNELGVPSSWEVIEGSPEFYDTTKMIHNALQGNQLFFSEADQKRLFETNRENAKRLTPILEEANYVIIHDPQPAPLIEFCPNRRGKWIWRCHIDATNPSRSVWNHLKNYIQQYDASIFSLADFVHPLPHPTYVIPPSIDPLSEKNCDLSEKEVLETYELFGIDPNRPVALQVSRFDRFKDPIGVIHAYQLAKKFVPDLQLILAGGTAADDPEGEIVIEQVRSAKGSDQDVHILLLPPDAHRTINALQRGATVILQKSIKEGFGLTVSEALWKGIPVIGGNVGGIRLQVHNYQTGFLVNTPEGAAQKLRFLIQNEALRKSMGERAKEFVRTNFLITRHLLEYMTLLISVEKPEESRFEL